MDAVFRALADPNRRLLLDRLNARNGQSLSELCVGLDMTRQSVSKHLTALEAAGLVTTSWRGREKLHYLNSAPINAIAERWISRYDQPRVQALADLKRALEDPVTTAFTYTTYINATPERVWQGLIDPAFTERYWGVRFATDWQVGSPMVWHERRGTTADPDQVVLAFEPPRLLSYTWHTFTPEWAESVGIDEDLRATLAGERRSKVTFEIEPVGNMVKLTVIHDDFDADSRVRSMCREGWPVVLASLKSLLETGEPLPDPNRVEVG